MNLKKIFLASSIKEFADERLSLKNFIRKMDDILVDHDKYLRLFICEYADNAVADERKQNEFLREIDDSDIFLILAGKNLGDYTLEEYQYAVTVHGRRNDGLPKILAAFKTCDETGQSIKDFSAILSADAERIDFKEITEIKVALAKAICPLLPSGIVHVENDKVIIAGKAI
jgi:DNA integrity scanning protein DisA with diadenylate cyclase activity